MPRTFRYYTLLNPLRDEHIDNGTSTLVSMPVSSNGEKLELSLLGVEDNPEMVRIAVTGLKDEPAPKTLKAFDDIAETFLALLQLFYKADLSFVEPRFRYANFIDDGLPPALSIGTKVTKPKLPLDGEHLRKFMNASEELRTIIRLYADSLNAHLPVQYRYLSAYKIIEHEFRLSRKKWKPGLETLLSHFEEEYKKLSLSKLGLKALIFTLRDKCAHIRTGGTHTLAIVGIGSIDTETVIRFLPLLTGIIQRHVAETYKL